MKREKVKSSVLKSVGYDLEHKVLETELNNDTVYKYFDVPLQEYQDFMKASSLGEYYNKHIKSYPFEKIK